MFAFMTKKQQIPDAESALPGRDQPVPTSQSHFVNGRPLKGPYPEGAGIIYFALGCYWGAERVFWKIPGVWVTAVGNMAGYTANPTYQEVCTGKTGHAETVMVVYQPDKVSLETLLKAFWESHDPTQGMRQGNDMGTQYRSGIYATTPGQLAAAEASRKTYQTALDARRMGQITTEIRQASEFYFAEDYHQQYLAKNPSGYCGLGGTGISCPALPETQ